MNAYKSNKCGSECQWLSQSQVKLFWHFISAILILYAHGCMIYALELVQRKQEPGDNKSQA